MGEKFFQSIYYYSHYIFVLTAINTAWLTCAIALDRYLTMVKVRPVLEKLKYRAYHRTILQSLFIMVFSIFAAVPSPLLLEVEENSEYFILKKIYNYFNAVMRAFVPLFVILFLNIRITQVIYNNQIKRKYKKASLTQIKKRFSVSLMLFCIVLTFSVCMFPDAIMTMMQLGYANEDYLVRSIREVTDLLLAINSSNTFPICYFFSIHYRQQFKDLFCAKSCRSPTEENQINNHHNNTNNKDLVDDHCYFIKSSKMGFELRKKSSVRNLEYIDGIKNKANQANI
jgi:nociceptin receptor